MRLAAWAGGAANTGVAMPHCTVLDSTFKPMAALLLQISIRKQKLVISCAAAFALVCFFILISE
jgi:hypothetical protein